MARTNYVKKFRGQRKCQYRPEVTKEIPWPSICGVPKAEHGTTEETADHEFLQKPLACEFCSLPIEIGRGYKWVAPRPYSGVSGRKRDRHIECPSWKQSELTSSAHLAGIYAAQEGAEEAMSGLSPPTVVDDAPDFVGELEGIAQAAAEEIEGVAEGYEESARNIEDGFGHPTYQSEELEQKGEEVRQWADMLRDLSLEEPDVEATAEDGEVDDTWLEDWAQEQMDRVTEELANVPV